MSKKFSETLCSSVGKLETSIYLQLALLLLRRRISLCFRSIYLATQAFKYHKQGKLINHLSKARHENSSEKRGAEFKTTWGLSRASHDSCPLAREYNKRWYDLFSACQWRLEPLLMGHFGSSHPTVGLAKKIQLVFPLSYLWHVKSDVASWNYSRELPWWRQSTNGALKAWDREGSEASEESDRITTPLLGVA